MGKREIGLILAFLLVGFAVYHVTAPPAKEGDEGFSLSRLFREIKSDLQRDMFTGEARSEASAPVPPAIVELEIAPFRGKLTIIGEDRDNVEAVLVATVSGSDRGEAERKSKEVAPRLTAIGESLRLDIQVPRQIGRLRSEMTLHVPSRLKVRAEVQSGATEISHVAAAAIVTRGELTIDDVKGALTGEHRDGDSKITRVHSMRLVLRRSNAHIESVGGPSILDAFDGDVELAGVSGELRFSGVRSDVTFTEPTGPLDVKTTDGSITVESPRADLRIESHRTKVDVRMAQAAAVHITTTDNGIELAVPPKQGISINAVATDGSIESEIPTVAVVSDERMQRATGAVNGGGPSVTLRATRGKIAITPSAILAVEK